MAAANNRDRIHETVLRAYTRPGHPTAFSAPARVAKHFGISQGRARKILEHIEGYRLHREYKEPRRYNPYYVHGRREQVQADLIDVSKIAAQNDGVRFLLLLIDILTKRVWVYPLQRKTSIEMRRALSSWLAALDVLPKKLVTDRGLEFVNRPTRALLENRNVEWEPAVGTLKACIVERANKTFQILIYKYLTENETLRYIDHLQRFAATYNGRGHRTLGGMTPDAADRPANEAHVVSLFHQRYAEAATWRKNTLPLKVGDVVRIKTLAKKVSSSRRSYAVQFQGEYYRIVRINRTLPIAMYHLRSMDNLEFIEGGFYAEELQRQRGDAFKVERVLARRRRRGRDEVLVKWHYFGDRWNQWIPAANIVRRF